MGLDKGKQNEKPPTSSKKRVRISQGAFPMYALEDVLRIPQAIKDNYAGQPTTPVLVADACGLSPTSSSWRYLTGSAVAYGLTDGSYNAKHISLTSLGERVVSPLREGDDVQAIKEAIQIPSILGILYKRYDGEKLPKSSIFENVLVSEGVPADRVKTATDIFKKNAIFAGVLKTISGNDFVILDSCRESSDVLSDNQATVSDSMAAGYQCDDLPSELLNRMNIAAPRIEEVSKPILEREKPHVFISHGKNNKKIVEQLKELITYGQMKPIVSVDRETTAIPVPDKVFHDMRECDAGIIHVDIEDASDGEGRSFTRINENVLIEIGAAIALYGKRVVLLCKKGTKLPSNLQGLYRSEYEGNQLDYAATMKILKTLQELRALMD